jgi:hypothetical protein
VCVLKEAKVHGQTFVKLLHFIIHCFVINSMALTYTKPTFLVAVFVFVIYPNMRKYICFMFTSISINTCQ